MLRAYRSTLILLLGAFFVLGLAAYAQEAAVPIQMDIVVRDSSGKLVGNLGQEAFQVSDNGQAQQLTAFAAMGEAAKAAPVRVALVFQGLGNQGRQYAKQTADDLFKALPDGSVEFAIFFVDRRIYLLQPFTSNLKELDKGVKLATSGKNDEFIKVSANLQEELDKIVASRKDPNGLNAMLLEVLKLAEQGQREDRTYAALDSLGFLSQHLGGLPGRRLIVLVSQGMVLQDNNTDRFNFTISTANLMNVPIYSVDANGLSTGSLAAGSQDMLSNAASQSQSQFGSSSNWQVGAMEQASQSLRMNAQDTLKDLAQKTGGFLTANTNDSRTPMRRLAEELTGFYRVAFVPADQKMDGQFRQVSLTVAGDGLQAQAATGYLDLPRLAISSGGAGDQFQSYEIPLLAALAKGGLENKFDLKILPLRYRTEEAGTHFAFFMDAPLSDLTFNENAEANLYGTHFSLLAVVKDAQGEIVEKFGQDYPLQGPLDKLDALKRGHIKFTEDVTIPAGSYTLQAALTDNYGKVTGGLEMPLEVPASGPGLKLSSVMLIDKADKVADPSQDPDNPLIYQGQKLTPNPGLPLIKTQGASLNLFWVAYPDTSSSDTVSTSLVFYSGGQPLAQTPAPAAQVDDKGRMQIAFLIPIETFPAGDYEVAVVAQQGQNTAEERVTFSIVAP